MMRVVGRTPQRVLAFAFTLLATLGGHVEARAAQLTLAWADASSDEVGFSIERSIGTGNNYEEIGTTSAGVTKYVDTSTASGTTYCYRVRAYSLTAYSDYSNMACATTAQGTSLAVVKAGATGGGTVVSNPPGITCGATCSASFGKGAAVVLTSTPTPGSVFAGWSGGGCSGTSTCTVILNASTVVTATFTAPTGGAGVTVAKAGNGSGTVTSTSGINCGTTCTTTVPGGTAVNLTAQAAAGSVFTGWSGAGCTGSSTCTVTPTTATTVTATFGLKTPPQVSLTVTKVGTGTGTVTTMQQGINCGSTCKQSYTSGTTVTLNAAAGPNSVFKGWMGGGCTGTTSCTLTLGSSRVVNATFKPKI
jgi:hypothetical protein